MSREYWGTPTFKKVNRVLSLAWGFAIVGIGLSSIAVAVLDERANSTSDAGLLDLILNWVVPIGIGVHGAAHREIPRSGTQGCRSIA